MPMSGSDEAGGADDEWDDGDAAGADAAPAEIFLIALEQASAVEVASDDDGDDFEDPPLQFPITPRHSA